MKDSILEIKNFGPISEAKIEIAKINVVAGVNASGKTTSSKILYSFLAAASTEGQNIYFNNMKKSIHSLSRGLLNSIDVDMIDSHLIDLSNRFEQLKFSKKSPIKQVEKTLKNLKNIAKGENINSNKLEDMFREVLEYFTKWENPDLRKLDIFSMILFDEFAKDDEFFNDDVLKSSLSFYEKDQNLMLGRSKPFKMMTDFFSDWIPVNDIFYIETPYIFDFSKYDDVKFQDHFYNREYDDDRFTYHQKSLINKIYHKKPLNWKFSNDKQGKNPLEMIDKIIFGHFSNKGMNKNEIRFQQCDKSFHVKNTAAGIKIIALIKLLLEKGLDTNSFIIMDEPEVHLHPDWQITLAEIVVVLSKKWDMRFYINTHSPHFIEAIEVYSKRYDLDHETNFYLTEIDENSHDCLNKFIMVKIEKEDLFILYKNLGRSYVF